MSGYQDQHGGRFLGHGKELKRRDQQHHLQLLPAQCKNELRARKTYPQGTSLHSQK